MEVQIEQMNKENKETRTSRHFVYHCYCEIPTKEHDNCDIISQQQQNTTQNKREISDTKCFGPFILKFVNCLSQ